MWAVVCDLMLRACWSCSASWQHRSLHALLLPCLSAPSCCSEVAEDAALLKSQANALLAECGAAGAGELVHGLGCGFGVKICIAHDAVLPAAAMPSISSACLLHLSL